MLIPDALNFSPEHTWAEAAGGLATVGITDHAQDELGDIVYLDLPEPGRQVEQGKSMGEIESVKTVSELISPVSGEVVERNQSAIDKPELVNSAPYGDGWLVKVRLRETSELARLLSAESYRSLTEPGP